MTALVLTDSATMLRRNLRRMRRYPSMTLFIAGIPVVLLDIPGEGDRATAPSR